MGLGLANWRFAAQGEIFAAEGYAKCTGKVGVCIATSGPGATNLVTGLADALLDSVPLVAITGQVCTLPMCWCLSAGPCWVMGVSMHEVSVRKGGKRSGIRRLFTVLSLKVVGIPCFEYAGSYFYIRN
jgi:Thiamine pyrophosphate enzyme, N-terminal TPP binding domain